MLFIDFLIHNRESVEDWITCLQTLCDDATGPITCGILVKHGIACFLVSYDMGVFRLAIIGPHFVVEAIYLDRMFTYLNKEIVAVMLTAANEALIGLRARNTSILYSPVCLSELIVLGRCFLGYVLQDLSVGDVEIVELFTETRGTDGKVAVKVNELGKLDLTVAGIPYDEVLELGLRPD